MLRRAGWRAVEEQRDEQRLPRQYHRYHECCHCVWHSAGSAAARLQHMAMIASPYVTCDVQYPAPIPTVIATHHAPTTIIGSTWSGKFQWMRALET